MMDWNAFGVVAACAWCGLLLALGVWKILNAESQSAQRLSGSGGRAPSLKPSLRLCVSALKQKPLPALVFFVCAAIATVEAQKPGQLRVENGELRVEMRRGEAAAATLNSQLSTLNSTRAANGGHPSPSPYVPDLGMGAWEESLRVGLPDVFPFGDEHLEAVEIFTQGYVRPRFNSAAKIADVGARLAIVPGLTTFTYGATTDGGYRIDWIDAAVSRDMNNLMTAAIELFRNGDVAVTTNGVSWTIPRELPFAHDGYGQDDEWVAANFTNATEIVAAGGYAAWVDAQVGEGLTNGLYKLTVGVAEDPPETVNLIVGDLSVAVTNAGAYVFLLEKGVEYDYGTVPFLTNVTSAAVDDVPSVQGPPRLLSAVAGGSGGWTVDGGYENREPTAEALGRVAWWPLFCGSPDVSHIGPDDGPVTFDAILSDYCGVSAVTYEWSASEGLTVVSPHAQSTAVRIEDMPSWAEAYLAVTATIGAKTLYSYTDRLTYGTNDTPQVHLSLSLPRIVIVDAGENGPCTLTAMFLPDVVTNGTLTLRCVSGADTFRLLPANGSGDAIELPQQWNAEMFSSVSFCVRGVQGCAAIDDVTLEWEYANANGQTQSVVRRMTVAEIHHLTFAEKPADRTRTTLGVGEQVMFYSEPNGLLTNAVCAVGSVTGLAEDGEVVFRAPSHATSTLVTVDCSGISVPFAFDVIEPDGYAVDRVIPLYLERANEAGYITLFFMNSLLPTNVSFYAVQVMEIPTVSTNAVGYYSQPSQTNTLDHGNCGAGEWVSLEDDNGYSDKASEDAIPPPWLDGGSYTWEIPFAWRVFDDANATNIICHFDQKFELDADGTARIRKFGYCGERTTNNVFTLVKELLP